MRAKSLGLRLIASLCAARRGASSVWMRCSSSSVFACVTAPNAAPTLRSSSPERSSPTMVLSKVGSAVWFAIASASASSCFMPSSSAGW